MVIGSYYPSVIHEIKVKNFRSIKQELIDYVYDQQRDPKGEIFLIWVGGNLNLSILRIKIFYLLLLLRPWSLILIMMF